MDEKKEIITEFLIESNENIGRLEQEFVALEKSPKDQALLSSIFRTIHTIKGTCGFLNFTRLESVTHLAENLLSQLRDGKRDLTSETVTVLLEAVDAVKRCLASIEATGAEPDDSFEELKGKLCRFTEGNGAAPATQAVSGPPREDPADTVSRSSLADSTIRPGRLLRQAVRH